MSKIKVMDAHLANMIAAGEVVERPSGIVKELVENALDAQANLITVKIIEGGMQEIEVTDNGEGMSAEDLKNAFQRHSTSKIHSADDLNRIHSFGFRGEALPSIASVSHVVVRSHDKQEGNEFSVDNGVYGEIHRAARNHGTTITVRELFSKVPARLKYIKNTRYEASIVLDTIQKFAVANPHVSFVLVSDEKEVFRTYGTQKLEDVFLSVFGQTVSRNAVYINDENFDFSIEAMIAQPEHTRANRHSIWLFINNRMVRMPKGQNAILEGYRRHIPPGRYPIAVVKITTDPQLVDVNVHPSKWEIRISKEASLISLIINAVEQALGTKTLAPRIVIEDREVKQTTMLEELLESKQGAFTSIVEPSQEIRKWTINESYNAPLEEVKSFDEPVDVKSEPVVEENNEQVDKGSVPLIEPLSVLSQMSGKYILAQGDNGLYIIDQHAAMERVRYEYYQQKLLDKESQTKQLLIPLILDGRSKLIPFEKEIISMFAKLGVIIEVFGEDCFIVREHPVWIKDNELKEFVETILDAFDTGKTVREEDFRRNALATLACHSSVRFNEYMSMEEMVELVEKLRRCTQPYHCPHGRPTFIVVEHQQLWKEFKR